VLPKNNVRRLAIFAVSKRDNPMAGFQSFLKLICARGVWNLYSQTTCSIRRKDAELILVELLGKVIPDAGNNAVLERHDLIG
jgi:hypothetical protein